MSKPERSDGAIRTHTWKTDADPCAEVQLGPSRSLTVEVVGDLKGNTVELRGGIQGSDSLLGAIRTSPDILTIPFVPRFKPVTKAEGITITVMGNA